MLSYYLISAPGDRKENEDAAGAVAWANGGIFVLADGLGGHGGSALASRCVVERLLRLPPPRQESELSSNLTRALQDAHSALLQLQHAHSLRVGGKSTAAVAVVLSEHLCIGHVGDSRVYIFGKRKLLRRTLDHSVPQILALAGQIREKDIRHHPDRNHLLRALGGGDVPLEIDIFSCTTQEIKALLLCSDGFWELINERQMEAALRRADTPQDWLRHMETIVLRNGRNYSMDNYSAIGIYL